MSTTDWMVEAQLCKLRGTFKTRSLDVLILHFIYNTVCVFCGLLAVFRCFRRSGTTTSARKVVWKKKSAPLSPTKFGRLRIGWSPPCQVNKRVGSSTKYFVTRSLGVLSERWQWQHFFHLYSIGRTHSLRQLWVRPCEWLKLNFASCVVHQTRSFV